MTIELARPLRLTDRLVQALEARIAAGKFRPGERLPTEKQLCEGFAVSRAVVREAVARLQSDGYVETRQGAGVFVTARPGLRSFKLPDEGASGPDELQHILELRLAVEVHAADLAAARRTDVDLAAMRSALEAMAEAVRAGTDGSDADDRFHIAIAAATHNPYLRRLVEFLRYQFWKSRRPTWSPAGHEAGEPRIAQREHERLYAVIAASDRGAAAAAARAHLLSSASRLGLADPACVRASGRSKRRSRRR
jgi:GntR family transcriptional regulator, transcriptional repressor for pyruvate dehydrogenase complex